MTLAQFVKTRRAELGLSLQKLADRCGSNKSTMFAIENGISENPKLSTICALAAALQISDVKLFRMITEDID